MPPRPSSFSLKLFYSYSHKDSHHKVSMENALSLLKRDGLVRDWSDQSILPGQNISHTIRSHIEDADIIVFLLSQDFIASDACMREWLYAKQLAATNKLLFLIPVIVRDCAWQDLLGKGNLKALPKDGLPVTAFDHPDAAWQQVYEGIKVVANELRHTFTVKPAFLDELQRTEFLSQQHLKLLDVFVFLPLLCHGTQDEALNRQADRLTTSEELLAKQYVLIHGADQSGKTALARMMFLKLTDQSQPVLFVDLSQLRQKLARNFFRRLYDSQFSGDYALWSQQQGKTLIIDNLTGHPDAINFVLEAKDTFDRVIVTLSSTVFHSFFRDESRLADFEELEIGLLTQVLQEKLIRQRLALSSGIPNFTDSDIDRIEDRVNSIIIHDKIVPRYPFFVLCILQTYEGYMPMGLSITSYGHCYYALIVASLVRAGISQEDSDINACFNFAEHLAFKTYEYTLQDKAAPFDFKSFIDEYRLDFFIPDSMVNRITHEEFGLIDKDGRFRTSYMQYFFLGRFLSKEDPANRNVIQRMCDAIYKPSNYLTLLFTIHHAIGFEIIDDILLRTMYTLDDVQPAQLNHEETRRFQDTVYGLPESILSSDSVDSQRQRERTVRDNAAEWSSDQFDEDWSGVYEEVNDCYRVLKNNEIMGQILRNKYGTMTKRRIEEVIEIMTDGGLRLINSVLKNEEEIVAFAQYEKAKNPDHDFEKIKRAVEVLSLIWTWTNIELVVRSINVPEIRASIDNVVKRAKHQRMTS